MLGDESGIERAVRLVPTRTGVTVPDWLLVGPTSDQLGAAGVMGAGWVFSVLIRCFLNTFIKALDKGLEVG